MPLSGLTGSRIRDRRMAVGMKQADVAKAVGISASYLNLIEHNRRSIGGKILTSIARALGCDVSTLSEGAEAGLLAALHEAAASGAAEMERTEEFVGRFPGWASVLAKRHDDAERLSHEIVALKDRLSHDPHLSESLHEVLTAATAIRSTTSILAETEDLDPNWTRRFLTSLDAEGRRLADGAEALVRYLDGAPAEACSETPQDEVQALFAARGWHLAEIEEGASPEAVVARAEELRTAAGRELAWAVIDRYARDARRLPLTHLMPHLDDPPGALAERFGVSPEAVLRRLAFLPDRDVGLIIADGAGAITFYRPLKGFPISRYQAGCPLWPLYLALTRPAQPLRAVIELPDTPAQRFLAEAIAVPQGPSEFGAPVVFETTMLLTPTADAANHAVGSTCRSCAREVCPARREPSVLRAGLA